MANELKITDLVGKEAFDQLTNLQTKITETYNHYKQKANEMAQIIFIKPNTLSELSDKSATYNKTLTDLATTQNKLAALQKEHESVLKKIEEQTRKNVAQILDEAKANELNAAAELKAQKAETERLKQQRMLNQEKRKAKITTEEAIALTSKEVHSINEAKEQNKLLRIAVAQVTDAEDKDNKIRQQLNGQIAKNTEYIRFNSDAYTRQKMAIGSYKNEIKAALVELKNGNSTFKNLGIVAKGFGGILKSNVSAGLAEVRIGVGSMIKGMVGAQAVISGFQKLIGLFKSGVQSIIDFEAANSKLAAILGTTSNNMKDLSTDAQRLGAATKYTASEATNLQIELAKLGFTRKEILQSTEGILKFAQATGADLPEAAALAGAALRMFDAETRETERYVSAMAVATTKSALSFSYLQTAMPIVGPVAKAFNFQIEDTLALLGKLSDAGFDASMAATATRNILLNLADGSGKLAQALGGPVKTLPELVSGLQKLKERGVDLNTTLELTDKRSVAAFNAFLTAADKIVPLREQITGVAGELNDMAETMGDNVQGAIAGLSSAWEAFMLSFYDSKGIMKDVLDFFAKGLREVARQLKSNDQLQEEANNQAVANAQKEMSRSDVLEKHRANIARLYKEKINEGMSADQAAIASKEEYIQTLRSRYEYENTAYQIAIQDRKKAEEELAKVGLFYFNSSNGLSRKQLQENIKTAITAAAGKKAIASVTESIIDDLNKIDLKQLQVSSGVSTLTDKEKRALEKASKERLRIQKEYQQSEIDLMDEGLGKELAKIRLNYTQRIAAVKGGTQEEMKTRENLAIAMEDELYKKIYTYNRDKEKINLQNRLDALSTNSQDELDQRLSLQLQINEILRESEVEAAKKTGEDINAINEKYNKKASDIAVKGALEKAGLIEKNTAKETNIVKNGAEDQLRALELSYRKGEISEREYRQQTYEITKKSVEAQLELLTAQLEAELKVLDPASDKSDQIRKKIESLRAEIRKLREESEDLTYGKEKENRVEWADAFTDALSNMKSAAEESLGDTIGIFSSFYSVIGKLTKQFEDSGIFSLSKWWKNLNPTEKATVILEAYAELFNGITSLMTSAFDSRIEQIEEEQERNEEAAEEEKERIEDLVESGVITKEEGEARKRAAEDTTARKNKELDKQKAELEQKQARWQKANSITQATISTALAIMQAYAQAGPFAGPVFAAIIAAIGAAQIAMIAAQPIPKYAKGTKDKSHPGGLAIVGDGGKREVILTDSGAYITPSVPTLVDMPKHAEVIPDVVDYKKMTLRSDAMMLDKMRRDKGEPVIVNVNNDYKNLERKMDVTNQGMSNLNKTLRKMARSAEYRYLDSKL
jgi:TP901 family phage tail tape measure protein